MTVWATGNPSWRAHRTWVHHRTHAMRTKISIATRNVVDLVASLNCLAKEVFGLTKGVCYRIHALMTGIWAIVHRTKTCMISLWATKAGATTISLGIHVLTKSLGCRGCHLIIVIGNGWPSSQPSFTINLLNSKCNFCSDVLQFFFFVCYELCVREQCNCPWWRQRAAAESATCHLTKPILVKTRQNHAYFFPRCEKSNCKNLRIVWGFQC